VKAELEVKRDILAGKFKEMKEHKKPIPVSFRRNKSR
jgi:hypothetical protein